MDDILHRLRELRPAMGGALVRIADFLLAEPAEAARLTITDLADRTGTSPGTVTRFCHTAGLDYVSCSPFRVPVARLAAAQAALTKRNDAE